jgi:hypothetical protein
MKENRARVESIQLRDYFAGLAMQAAISNPVWGKGKSFADIAKDSYQMADAMLAARGKV